MSRRVVVHKNVAGSVGSILMVDPSWNMKRFLRAAGKQLNLRKGAKLVFLGQTGIQIQEMGEIQNNDLLYISQGEPYYKRDGPNRNEEKVTMSVLGTGGVGKSALTLRFTRDHFVEEWDPTIEDAYRKTLDVDDSLCTIEILDTAGQDDFLSLRPQWMIEKDGYIFVYSMNSRHSLEELQHFFELHQQINEHREVPIVLVANKKDLCTDGRGQVTTEQGMEQARQWNATYIETSAFTGENVEAAFKTFIRSVRKGRSPKPPAPTGFCTLL